MTHFFLSISGTSLFSALSTTTCSSQWVTDQNRRETHTTAMTTNNNHTGILSGYFSLMRAASACLLSGMCKETNFKLQYGLLTQNTDHCILKEVKYLRNGTWPYINNLLDWQYNGSFPNYYVKLHIP